MRLSFAKAGLIGRRLLLIRHPRLDRGAMATDFVTPGLIALLSGINQHGRQPNKVAWFFNIRSSFCLRLPYAWR